MPTASVIESDAQVYERLKAAREPYLTRARANALLTVPSLAPPEGHTGDTELPKPYQSIGSHGVNTLAAKLVTTILPPNVPMFRISVTDQTVEELDEAGSRSEVEKKLNEIERSGQEEIESIGVRSALTEAMKYLVVTGNVLLYLPKKGNLRTFTLERYVVQRDPSGAILQAIIKETIAREVLPEVARKIVEHKTDLPSDKDRDLKEYDVYTVFKREGGRIKLYQSILGVQIPGTQGSWEIDKAPIMALRWSYLHDEDYGRSYVDEYYGDLQGVESLSQSLREGAAIASKVNPMVRPDGVTDIQDVTNSENLEVISGRPEDVGMLQFDKQADYNFVMQTLETITTRLEHAFMMNRAVQRSGERVTAEEIRSMISDIDNVLGGIYSLLARDLQLPLVSRVLDRMVREKKIPDIESIKGEDGQAVATPKVITGVEALGRGQDYNKYVTLFKEIIVPIGEAAYAEINLGDFIRRAAVSLSIDTDGLIKSKEDKGSEQQQAQALQEGQAAQQLTGDVVKGVAPQIAKAAATGQLDLSSVLPQAAE